MENEGNQLNRPFPFSYQCQLIYSIMYNNFVTFIFFPLSAQFRRKKIFLLQATDGIRHGNHILSTSSYNVIWHNMVEFVYVENYVIKYLCVYLISENVVFSTRIYVWWCVWCAVVVITTLLVRILYIRDKCVLLTRSLLRARAFIVESPPPCVAQLIMILKMSKLSNRIISHMHSCSA